MRNKVFKAYGGYTCNCCGETERTLLTIDHTEENGAKHRKEMKKNSQKEGRYIYRWLIVNNFPKGFQVLCRNCNYAKFLNWKKNKIKECPHGRKGVSIVRAQDAAVNNVL